MDKKFPERVEEADDHVKDHPDQRQPASPVLPHHETHPGNHGRQFCQFDCDCIRWPAVSSRK